MSLYVGDFELHTGVTDDRHWAFVIRRGAVFRPQAKAREMIERLSIQPRKAADGIKLQYSGLRREIAQLPSKRIQSPILMNLPEVFA
jgi:hypothetical protein